MTNCFEICQKSSADQIVHVPKNDISKVATAVNFTGVTFCSWVHLVGQLQLAPTEDPFNVKLGNTFLFDGDDCARADSSLN